MKAVITAILTDAEARAGDAASAPSNANFGHLREPVLFMANVLRGLNATLGTSSAIDRYSAELGEQIFYPATVFSYFSPLYTLEDGEPAPEFQIYSAQTAANRADIVNTVLYGALDKSTTIDLTSFLPNGRRYQFHGGLHQQDIPASCDVQRSASGRDQRGRRGHGGARRKHRPHCMSR